MNPTDLDRNLSKKNLGTILEQMFTGREPQSTQGTILKTLLQAVILGSAGAPVDFEGIRATMKKDVDYDSLSPAARSIVEDVSAVASKDSPLHRFDEGLRSPTTLLIGGLATAIDTPTRAQFDETFGEYLAVNKLDDEADALFASLVADVDKTQVQSKARREAFAANAEIFGKMFTAMSVDAREGKTDLAISIGTVDHKTGSPVDSLDNVRNTVAVKIALTALFSSVDGVHVAVGVGKVYVQI